MSDGPKPSEAAREVDRIAAEWVLRGRDGLSPNDRRDLDEWLCDPHHAIAFAEMKRTSELLDDLRDRDYSGDRTRPKRRTYWLVGGLAAAAATVLIWSASRRAAVVATDSLVQTASTDVGELRNLELPDGSVVGLNTNSAVDIAYTPNERRIKLTRGEAFFNVAKNPHRPFWVEAGQVSLRAVGTAFSVRYRADAIEVLVREGKVQVNQAGARQPEPLLLAGERAVVSLGTETARGQIAVAPIEPMRMQSALAWQAQRLEFSDVPLAEVIAEFNRYNRHQLLIDDPALATQIFGGAFDASGYQSLVEVLEQSFGVVAERRANVTILRKAR